MSNEDKSLIRRLYSLTDFEVIEAEKLHRRAGFTICGAAKAVAAKRKNPLAY